MYGFSRPTRPIASCTVAEPKRASSSAAARSARTMLRFTTPSSYISLPLGFQRRIQAWEHAARVAFVDHLLLLGRQDRRGLDVALGVVVIEARLRVDAAHGADHFAGEQDVLHRDHLGQQVDARLVVDAGVEE